MSETLCAVSDSGAKVSEASGTPQASTRCMRMIRGAFTVSRTLAATAWCFSIFFQTCLSDSRQKQVLNWGERSWGGVTGVTLSLGQAIAGLSGLLLGMPVTVVCALGVTIQCVAEAVSIGLPLWTPGGWIISHLVPEYTACYCAWGVRLTSDMYTPPALTEFASLLVGAAVNSIAMYACYKWTVGCVWLLLCFLRAVLGMTYRGSQSAIRGTSHVSWRVMRFLLAGPYDYAVMLWYTRPKIQSQPDGNQSGSELQYCDPLGLVAIAAQYQKKEMAIPENPMIPVDKPPNFIFTVNHPTSNEVLGVGSRIRWGEHDALLLTTHQVKGALKYSNELWIGGPAVGRVAPHPVITKKGHTGPGAVLMASSPNEKKGGRDMMLIMADPKIMSGLQISAGRIDTALENAPITIYTPPLKGAGWMRCSGVIEPIRDILVKYHISTLHGSSGSPLISGGKVVGVHVENSGNVLERWNKGSLLPHHLPKESAGEMRRRQAVQWGAEDDFGAEEGFDEDHEDDPEFITFGETVTSQKFRAKGRKILTKARTRSMEPEDAWASLDDDTSGHLDYMRSLGYTIPKERRSLNGSGLPLNPQEVGKSCLPPFTGASESTPEQDMGIKSKDGTEKTKHPMGSSAQADLMVRFDLIQDTLQYLLQRQQRLEQNLALKAGYSQTEVQEQSTDRLDSKPVAVRHRPESPTKRSLIPAITQAVSTDNPSQGPSSSPLKGGRPAASPGSPKGKSTGPGKPANSQKNSAQTKSGQPSKTK